MTNEEALQERVAERKSEGESRIAHGVDKDEEARQSILALLYVSRRKNVNKPGLGIVHLEDGLGGRDEFLEFHLWYLKEKGWIHRMETGEFAITVLGVDEVTRTMLEKGDRVLSALGRKKERKEEKIVASAEARPKEPKEKDNWYL